MWQRVGFGKKMRKGKRGGLTRVMRVHVRMRRQTSDNLGFHVKSREKIPERTGWGEELAYRILGHLSFKPSSQRIYSNSAMGDLRAGSGSATATKGSDVEGNPLISCSSVTTSPFEVISLFRMIRLCGNKTREVLTCCFTALFLAESRIKKWKARIS